MIDLDPDHPLTRHLSVAYWKGGDESVERQLYRPEAIEKIIAWGGLAAVRHVTQYIQPGLELITLDPKRSMSIVGAEALKNDVLSRESALRLATDIGAHNQEACVNARVVFVQSGGALDEGAIIVSQLPEPVGFATALAGRVANLVPFDDVDEIFASIDAYTQTIGIFPESLKAQLRDRLPLYGAQRITSLGYAASAALAAPQDAIEPLRRMCKWIVEETCDPATCKPLWQL